MIGVVLALVGALFVAVGALFYWLGMGLGRSSKIQFVVPKDGE